VSTYLANHGIDHLHRKTTPVLKASTVLIAAIVGAVLRKLLQEVPIRTMDLHAVEPSLNCIPRSA
jgi:hypothetical protein